MHFLSSTYGIKKEIKNEDKKNSVKDENLIDNKDYSKNEIVIKDWIDNYLSPMYGVFKLPFSHLFL